MLIHMLPYLENMITLFFNFYGVSITLYHNLNHGGRGGSWVGLLGSGGRFSRRTQGVWGAGPPTAGGTPKAKPDVF